LPRYTDPSPGFEEVTIPPPAYQEA
jgi:hypothetical protein